MVSQGPGAAAVPSVRAVSAALVSSYALADLWGPILWVPPTFTRLLFYSEACCPHLAGVTVFLRPKPKRALSSSSVFFPPCPTLTLHLSSLADLVLTKVKGPLRETLPLRSW